MWPFSSGKWAMGCVGNGFNRPTKANSERPSTCADHHRPLHKMGHGGTITGTIGSGCGPSSSWEAVSIWHGQKNHLWSRPRICQWGLCFLSQLFFLFWKVNPWHYIHPLHTVFLHDWQLNQHIFAALGIKHAVSSAYHPQTNGQVSHHKCSTH